MPSLFFSHGDLENDDNHPPTPTAVEALRAAITARVLKLTFRLMRRPRNARAIGREIAEWKENLGPEKRR